MGKSFSKPMSKEEKARLYDISRKLAAEGKRDEAHKISMQVPIAPHLAMAAKEVFGAEYVRNSGFNLYEVLNGFFCVMT